MRLLAPATDQATIRLTHGRALEQLPALRSTRITASWTGYVDSTLAGIPGIGEITSLSGFIVAASFSDHGFRIGTGTGTGQLITDRDPKLYHPDRFEKSASGNVADF